MLGLKEAKALVAQCAGLVEQLSSLAAFMRAELKSMSDLNSKIAALQADVAAIKSSEASALTLISGLSSQLTSALEAAKANGLTDDQAAELDALDAALKDQASSLAAAVAANTPTPAEAVDAAAGDGAEAEQQPEGQAAA